MGDEIRIGVEPPPAAPPRSGKVILLVAGLILLVAFGAWLAGTFHDTLSPATTTGAEPSLTSTTTTTATTTTALLEDRLQRARTFWTALGVGDAAGAAAVAAPTPAAGDLIAFVSAFRPEFTLGTCEPFAADTIRCTVVVGNDDLLAVGTGDSSAALRMADDGSFDLPPTLASAAARLSLYALQVRTEEVRAACPLTASPAVLGLAIVGSPTAGCGAYLAGLIPEYLSSVGPTP